MDVFCAPSDRKKRNCDEDRNQAVYRAAPCALLFNSTSCPVFRYHRGCTCPFTTPVTYLVIPSSRDSTLLDLRSAFCDPLVISASGSLDLEDLHEVGRPNWFQKGPAKAAVAQDTTQFHWQDSSLSTESSRCEKPPACISALGIAVSSPGRTSHPKTCQRLS